MAKPLLTILELERGKLYDQLGNQYPNHILYFLDEDGYYCQKDLIAKTESKLPVLFNDLIKERFYEVETKKKPAAKMTNYALIAEFENLMRTETLLLSAEMILRREEIWKELKDRKNL